jgi:hypothetical protein
MKTSNSNTKFDNQLVSIRSLSALTGQDRDTVRSNLNRADIEPAGQLGGYPAYRLSDAIRAMLARHGDVDPATLTPQDRKALADAKLREHTLAIKSGEYLPRDAYRSATAEAYARCASSIRSIPDNLEHRLGLTPEQAEFAEEVIDRILGTLYTDMKATHEANTATA